MMKKIDIPPAWLLASMFAAWFLARVWPVYSFHVSSWIAGILVGGGVYLVIWSVVWFRKRHTTLDPRDTPATLVVEGPYKINRNPIYTGMTVVLLGVALWLGELTALIPVLLFPLIITVRFIRGEEQTLRETFGEAAEKYFAGSRRW